MTYKLDNLIIDTDYRFVMSAGTVDRVKRPDHYKCLNCGERFNDAKFVKSQESGIHSAVASCPHCESTKIKISWWKKKDV